MTFRHVLRPSHALPSALAVTQRAELKEVAGASGLTVDSSEKGELSAESSQSSRTCAIYCLHCLYSTVYCCLVPFIALSIAVRYRSSSLNTYAVQSIGSFIGALRSISALGTMGAMRHQANSRCVGNRQLSTSVCH